MAGRFRCGPSEGIPAGYVERGPHRKVPSDHRDATGTIAWGRLRGETTGGKRVVFKRRRRLARLPPGFPPLRAPFCLRAASRSSRLTCSRSPPRAGPRYRRGGVWGMLRVSCPGSLAVPLPQPVSVCTTYSPPCPPRLRSVTRPSTCSSGPRWFSWSRRRPAAEPARPGSGPIPAGTAWRGRPPANRLADHVERCQPLRGAISSRHAPSCRRGPR